MSRTMVMVVSLLLINKLVAADISRTGGVGWLSQAQALRCHAQLRHALTHAFGLCLRVIAFRAACGERRACKDPTVQQQQYYLSSSRGQTAVFSAFPTANDI